MFTEFLHTPAGKLCVQHADRIAATLIQLAQSRADDQFLCIRASDREVRCQVVHASCVEKWDEEMRTLALGYLARANASNKTLVPIILLHVKGTVFDAYATIHQIGSLNSELN